MEKEEKKIPENSSDTDIQQVAAELTQGTVKGNPTQALNPQSFIPQTGQPANNQDFVKQIVSNDLAKIQNLMQSGMINPAQGQNLVNGILKKACEMITNSGTNNTPVATETVQNQPTTGFDEESLKFFSQDGRSEVLDYLKNSNAAVDKDGISQICKLVERIENGAVEKYLKQAAHDKTLNDENEAAKSRLRANAQNAGTGNNKNKVFTREQIGKMSGAEFAKNERIIMEQLRKGLIR